MYYSLLHILLDQMYFWHELCFIICLSKGNLLLEPTHTTNMSWESPFNVKSLGQHLHLIPSPLRQAWINLRCTGVKILFSSLFWYYQRVASRHIHLLTLHYLGTKSGDCSDLERSNIDVNNLSGECRAVVVFSQIKDRWTVFNSSGKRF